VHVGVVKTKTELNREKREKRKARKLRKQGRLVTDAVKVNEVARQTPVGVRDVASQEQLVKLATQRAELYELENERKILKMRREIAMEKATNESGADKQRVDNWIADVKSGSSKSSGSGWASQKTRKTKWSGSWRSRQTVSTDETVGETVVSEEVHNAVLKKVKELEARVAGDAAEKRVKQLERKIALDSKQENFMVTRLSKRIKELTMGLEDGLEYRIPNYFEDGPFDDRVLGYD